MALALLKRVSPGRKARGRGPGRGAGNTHPAGGQLIRKGPAGKRSVKGKPAKGRVAKGRPAQGATRKVAAAPAPRRSMAWLNWLMILAGAGIVLAAATKAYLTLQAVPVQQITVTGELAHTQMEMVQEMVQPALAGGFLRADLQRIREQLQSLPWIYEATVRRKWPAELEIHVVEQLPIARWGEDGFLNHEGAIFHSARSGAWEALPLLQGPEGSAGSLMATYRRMVAMLSPLGINLEQLVVDERGQVEAMLVGGTRLILGGDDFLERMHRFVEIYRRELAARAADVARVDLRYQSGVAVAFREPPQVAGR